MILTTWVAHNNQQCAKLRKGAEEAQDVENCLIYPRAGQEPEGLGKVNEQLSWALIEMQETR